MKKLFAPVQRAWHTLTSWWSERGFKAVWVVSELSAAEWCENTDSEIIAMYSSRAGAEQYVHTILAEWATCACMPCPPSMEFTQEEHDQVEKRFPSWVKWFMVERTSGRHYLVTEIPGPCAVEDLQDLYEELNWHPYWVADYVLMKTCTRG